jgi:hypothetical protein
MKTCFEKEENIETQYKAHDIYFSENHFDTNVIISDFLLLKRKFTRLIDAYTAYTYSNNLDKNSFLEPDDHLSKDTLCRLLHIKLLYGLDTTNISLLNLRKRIFGENHFPKPRTPRKILYETFFLRRYCVRT